MESSVRTFGGACLAGGLALLIGGGLWTIAGIALAAGGLVLFLVSPRLGSMIYARVWTLARKSLLPSDVTHHGPGDGSRGRGVFIRLMDARPGDVYECRVTGPGFLAVAQEEERVWEDTSGERGFFFPGDFGIGERPAIPPGGYIVEWAKEWHDQSKPYTGTTRRVDGRTRFDWK